MHKALGIVLIFLSLGFFSYKRVESRRIKLFNLNEFLKALTILKNELSFSMPEMSVLCKKVSSKTSGEISHIFKETQNLLSQDAGTDFLTVWKSAVEEDELFSENAKAEILNFCEGFGKKTIDIELENIKRCEKVLDGLKNTENEKFIKERKLIYTFGVSIGLVVVILGI